MNNWYVQKGGQRLGPMSFEAIQSMATTGQLAATDYVWTDGMANWQPASTQPWFPAQPQASVPFVPPQQYPPYGQQAPQFGQPGMQFGGQPPIAEPPSLTGWAIAVLLLCCLPGGIVGLIYGNKAKTEWAKGNFAGAQSAYNTGKTWLIVSACLGLVITAIYIIGIAASNR
ncbi:CD225/dispanin family protein [Acidicapsa dinghuensis]|uniref:CD225/dispanin family protein n=1 Tax=Acidicapsa dinghuensis TaxID=2218256 RepID=A0ABW1ENX1_9BACT|nr:CD225/dispanin family protein [Acidicapsa dinghuensis]